MTFPFKTLAVAAVLASLTHVAAAQDVPYANDQSRSAQYTVTFINFTPQAVVLNRTAESCMYNAGDQQIIVNSGDYKVINMEDNNNYFGDCTNAEKTVTWDVSQYNGSAVMQFWHAHDGPSDCTAGTRCWETTIYTNSTFVPNTARCNNQNCLNTQVKGDTPAIDIIFR